MKKRHHPIIIFTILFFVGCTQPQPPISKQIQLHIELSTEEMKRVISLASLPTVPKNPTNAQADNPKASLLGQMFFYEKKISRNQLVSCATCHNPQKGWSDALPLSKGLETVRRHAPSLWNVAYNRWFTWDGRADSMWNQALGPIEDSKEMGFSRLEIAHFVASHSEYKKRYEEIFGVFPDLSDANRFPSKGFPSLDSQDEFSQNWNRMNEQDQKTIQRIYSNVGKTLEAFQRNILSKESLFDHFVEGIQQKNQAKIDLLSMEAQKGLKLFVGKANCVLCHHSGNFSDGEFHNIGLKINSEVGLDQGRFAGISQLQASLFLGTGLYSDAPQNEINDRVLYVSRSDSNLGEFKTPTLRNIAETAPYMHDGRFKTLEEVLNFYNKLPDSPAIGHREESLKPLQLSEEELKSLIAFLKSLTGKPIASSFLQAP